MAACRAHDELLPGSVPDHHDGARHHSRPPRLQGLRRKKVSGDFLDGQNINGASVSKYFLIFFYRQ
jgi:hypothetical protein